MTPEDCDEKLGRAVQDLCVAQGDVASITQAALQAPAGDPTIASLMAAATATFYGTTTSGGIGSGGYFNNGTVFKIAADGSETVVADLDHVLDIRMPGQIEFSTASGRRWRSK
jgi:hypothetical protein